MKFLLAPWRWAFLSKPCARSGCVFCNAVSREDPDDLILYQGRHMFVILNKFPYSTGHLMVVPYAHLASPEYIPAEGVEEMWALLNRAIGILRTCFSPEGFNVGMNIGGPAGAGIPGHVHLHLVPRWPGDANFMATTAGTRVVSYDIRQVVDIMRKEFAS